MAITWNDLTIEITRRCNVACPHCMRGDAQDLDMPNNVIDNLLSQTDVIGRLTFTGGEPSIAIERLRAFLAGLKKWSVAVFNLHIVTNGKTRDTDFIKVIKEYSDHMKIYNPDFSPDNIHINVSCDRWHTKAGINCDEVYWWHKVFLHGIAKVKRHKLGEMPKKDGRAKNLDDDLCIGSVTTRFRKGVRVELLDTQRKPACAFYKNFQLVSPKQKIVVCSMGITARGELTFWESYEVEYDTLTDDLIICNVESGDIYSGILAYNERNSMTCPQYMKGGIEHFIEYANNKYTNTPRWVKNNRRRFAEYIAQGIMVVGDAEENAVTFDQAEKEYENHEFRTY